MAERRYIHTVEERTTLVHGTVAGYNIHECRCVACTTAWRIYTRALKYKIAPAVLATMLASGCAACGALTDLTIDHDHRCCGNETTCGGCVCGVLCNPCNKAAGMLNDDPDRAEALAAYLRTTRT